MERIKSSNMVVRLISNEILEIEFDTIEEVKKIVEQWKYVLKYKNKNIQLYVYSVNGKKIQFKEWK